MYNVIYSYLVYFVVHLRLSETLVQLPSLNPLQDVLRLHHTYRYTCSIDHMTKSGWNHMTQTYM